MPKLSKEDVILKLMELGVKYDSKASYSDLLKTLKAAEEEDDKALEQESAEPPKVVSTDEKENKEVSEAQEEPKKPANPFSSFTAKTPMGSKAHEMKKVLDSQPKEFVYVPMQGDESVGATLQVTLNGYTMFIRKGTKVEVPRQVAEIINEKLAHQEHVLTHPFRVAGKVPDTLIKPFN